MRRAQPIVTGKQIECSRPPTMSKARGCIARSRAIKSIYRRTGGRGTVGTQDVNRVGSGSVVGGGWYGHAPHLHRVA